jgi:D-alanyl-D-alanine carboxypeptidase
MTARARLGAGLLVLGVLLAGLAPALADENLSSPERLLAYLAEHREDVALASYTAGPGGAPHAADPLIAVNDGRPMSLASTIKITLLAGYAREVASGRVDPDEPVTLREWDRFYLPFTDNGAHLAALEELAIGTDPLGFAMDPRVTVALDRIVRAMVRWSDNAAADLLLERLGDGIIQEVVAEAGMADQEKPLPILGIFLSWFNHEDGPLTEERVSELLRMADDQYEARVRELTAAYQHEAWRATQIAWLIRQQEPPYRLLSTVSNRLFPQGTAGDYARIMAGVITARFSSPEASAIMRRHLEWPLEAPENREAFTAFGTKGGSLPGVLTEATFVVPSHGDFAGQPRISALLLRNLPDDAYQQLRETFFQQELVLRIGTDRSFAEEAKRRLEG